MSVESNCPFSEQISGSFTKSLVQPRVTQVYFMYWAHWIIRLITKYILKHAESPKSSFYHPHSNSSSHRQWGRSLQCTLSHRQMWTDGHSCDHSNQGPFETQHSLHSLQSYWVRYSSSWCRPRASRPSTYSRLQLLCHPGQSRQQRWAQQDLCQRVGREERRKCKSHC